MTAIRRSTDPRPGGTDRERAIGMTTKILSRWSGGYQDTYGCTREGGGGGSRRDTGTTRIERELERSPRQARYPGDDWRQDEGLTTIAGGAISRGHRKNREGTRASGRHATRATTDNETRDERLKTIAGGAVS